MTSCFSFDIFDTVLTRRLSCPVDVFTMVGKRLKSEGIRIPPFGLFRKLRIRSERWSRRFEPSYEVLLPDIYRLLGRILMWSESQRLRAAEIEREIEASVLCATPFGCAAVCEARRNGCRVAFVSDMYLEGDFLRSLLARENLGMPDDLIAVSGEWKCSKAGSMIWPALLKQLKVAPAELFHQGDNLLSDVESPQRHGIAAKRLGTAEVSRWEQWQPKRSPLSVESWGGIAALSRMARVSCENPDDYWTQLGTGVLGPMLVGFTSWLLAQAKNDGIQTLWFLSRDGWLFYRAAQLINDDPKLQLQYIGVNRLQLGHAQEGSRALVDLFSGSRKITWELLAERLCFSAAELESLQSAVGSSKDRGARLSKAEQEEVVTLLAQADWQELLIRKAHEAGENVKAYVAQCQSSVTGALGLVDIGWAGRTQDGLQQFCPTLEQGYYLGLCGQKPFGSPKRAWLFDTSTQDGACSLNFFQRMIEVLIGGVSGPLQGYVSKNNALHPRFAPEEQGEFAPGREIMQLAAIEFVKYGAKSEFAVWWTSESMQTFAGWNLRQLLECPTQQDAKAFRDWQITTDDAHQDSIQPAKGFDFSRIVTCLKGQQAWGLLWPQASLQNSSQTSRWFMQVAQQLRRLRHG